MSVKIDSSGRRSIQVEVEVPGTPEQVWQAIATGAGVSSWFVPTQIQEREGGAITVNFGPGMELTATITAWDPPHRFSAENPGPEPNAPALATEWIVEARDGGTCVVRVVQSHFAATDDWDDQLEGSESGWPAWFRILRLYMAHFRGQPCSSIQVMGMSTVAVTEAWKTLNGALGLSGIKPGLQWTSPGDAPKMGGTIDAIQDGPHYGMFLRLEQPAPGIGFLMASAMGGQAFVGLYSFFYGDRASSAAEESGPRWQGWMNQHFPPPQ